MEDIKKVILYFANPQQDKEGEVLAGASPESHELSWYHVQDGATITLSTGEVIAVKGSKDKISVQNAFYFGTGKFGNLLGITLHNEQETWIIKEIIRKGNNSEQLDILLKPELLNMSYEELIGQQDWKMPYIGEQSDVVELSFEKTVIEEPMKAAAIRYNNIELNPSIFSIYVGEVGVFDATHTYSGTPTWVFDPSLEVVEKTNKRLRVRAKALGNYEIRYKIGQYEERSMLYVGEPTSGWVNPDEPTPPSLPNTPPTEIQLTQKIIQLADASQPVKPLHKYPNVMKRNARYRGTRESEKYLNDHQEQIYEIRQIYKDLDTIKRIENKSIYSWFHEVGINSISMNAKGYENNSEEIQDISSEEEEKSVRAFADNMIQLSGNSLEERIVGIYGIKRRMQEIDERIAEVERRYREYENAYE